MSGHSDYSGFPYTNYKLLYIYTTLFSGENGQKQHEQANNSPKQSVLFLPIFHHKMIIQQKIYLIELEAFRD